MNFSQNVTKKSIGMFEIKTFESLFIAKLCILGANIYSFVRSNDKKKQSKHKRSKKGAGDEKEKKYYFNGFLVTSVYQKYLHENVFRSKEHENFSTKDNKLAISSFDDRKTPEQYLVNSMITDENDFLFLDKYQPEVCSLPPCDTYSSFSEKKINFSSSFRKKLCL